MDTNAREYPRKDRKYWHVFAPIRCFYRLMIFLCLAMPIFENSAYAGADTAQILKDAQAALASGDYGKAFDSYRAVAEQAQNPLAQFTVALFYQNGWGRAVDRVAACRWFELAAYGGISAAQHFTGVCFEQGLHRPADSASAAAWYQKAAQAGHFVSYCHLGHLYMTGTGVPKDPLKALSLCHPAAQQGSAPAQVWMGKFYFGGDASIQSLQEAYRWFEAAALQQTPEAFFYLGQIVQQGQWPQHMPQKARQLFEHAAALKYIPAYFQTGKLFFSAEPDPQTGQLAAEDLAKAYLWLSAALQQSENSDERAEAKKMLQRILAVMPETWLTELDREVAQHIQR